MKKRELTLAELALIAGTRVLSGKLTKDKRRAAGWTLVTVGAVNHNPAVDECVR